MFGETGVTPNKMWPSLQNMIFFNNTNVLDTEFSKRNENLFHSQIKGVGAQHKT